MLQLSIDKLSAPEVSPSLSADNRCLLAMKCLEEKNQLPEKIDEKDGTNHSTSRLHSQLDQVDNDNDEIITPQQPCQLLTQLAETDDAEMFNAGMSDGYSCMSGGEMIEIIEGDGDHFLLELKEEVQLQTLLYRHIHDKKQCVFDLHHRNRRKLLVVLPPYSKSLSRRQKEQVGLIVC